VRPAACEASGCYRVARTACLSTTPSSGSLGAPATDTFIRDEMQRQFAVLAAAIPAGPRRDAHLCHAAVTALDELDDAE